MIKDRIIKTKKSIRLFIKILCISPTIAAALFVLTIIIGLIPTLEVTIIANIGSALLNNKVEKIFLLLSVLIVCKLATLLFNQLVLICREKIHLKISKELELELINKTLKIELRDKEQIEYNDRYTRAFNAVNPNQLLSLLTTFPDFIANIVSVVSLSILLFSINYIVPIIIIGVFVLTIKEKISAIEKYYCSINEETTELRRTNKLISYIMNKNTLTELRMYRAYEWLLAQWKKCYNAWAKKHMKTITANSIKMQILSAFMERFVFPIICLVLYISESVSISNVIICLQGVEQLSASLNMIINNISFISVNGEICENYFGLLEHKEREPLVDVDTDAVAIECRDVCFAYEEDKNILKNINLSIARNEIVALVGYNGSGKTTLSKILLHIYKPTKGNMKYCWDKKFPKEAIIPKRSVLYQDFCVYKDMSIFENVAISKTEDIDIKQVENIVNSMGLKSSSVLIGNEFGGIELSSGQSQKVAFARCLNNKCGLVLLDEPLSFLDPYSEYNLIKKFIETFSGSTRIFTTHRLSCTKLADRILVMDDGNIVEEGDHNSLMEQKGKYYELFKAQAELYK